jgi:hypothetical protein
MYCLVSGPEAIEAHHEKLGIFIQSFLDAHALLFASDGFKLPAATA